MKKISIIGSGAWAYALTKILLKKEITVKCRNLKVARKRFHNKKITLINNYKEISFDGFIFLAIPSQTIRQNLKDLKEVSKKNNSIFVICSKGVEKKTNKLMSEVVKDIFPQNKLAILSGPNFSSELILKKPCASVLSSSDSRVSMKISKLISQKEFRTYFNNDIIGTQLGGAMKNIIAIACGLLKGKGLGENARAAIITRGISEIVKLGLKMGAKRKTFYGLSGIGDLTLTCSSLKSRNTKFGYDLGRGEKLQILRKNNILEGVESCESICRLGEIYNIELPLCNSVKQIINGDEINKIISYLLSRPLQFES